METNKQETEAPKVEPSSLPPSAEDLKKWIRKDLESAHYLLGVVLQRYPEIVDDMAAAVYENVMRKENGSAIDHVRKD